MRNQGLPLHVNPTMRYKYCSYWGTWNRVLQFPIWNAENNRKLDMVEFSLTPINGDRGDWNDVASVRVRKHGTMIDKNDTFHNALPLDWWNLIGERIGTNRRDFMAYYNSFLDEIDWTKYSQFNNGGASFERIMK